LSFMADPLCCRESTSPLSFPGPSFGGLFVPLFSVGRNRLPPFTPHSPVTTILWHGFCFWRFTVFFPFFALDFFLLALAFPVSFDVALFAFFLEAFYPPECSDFFPFSPFRFSPSFFKFSSPRKFCRLDPPLLPGEFEREGIGGWSRPVLYSPFLFVARPPNSSPPPTGIYSLFFFLFDCALSLFLSYVFFPSFFLVFIPLKVINFRRNCQKRFLLSPVAGSL